MPTTPTPMLQTPRQKAILGTAVVFVLLVLFAFVGFWYGKKQNANPANSSTITTQTNTNADATASTGTLNQKTVIIGKITKVLANAIEISTGSGDSATTITATMVGSTIYRKLDLRTIPKNGIGDGSPIAFSDFKVGNQVVIATADTSSTKVNASKVSMVIYP